MSNVIQIKKGLDIKLEGAAEKVLTPTEKAVSYALRPADFEGVVPKMLVSPGEKVKAGDPLFFDKYRPNLIFTSPVSGEVASVNRGEKRKILEIVVTPDAQEEYKQFDLSARDLSSAEEIKKVMLEAGLWPMIIQRPFGVIADETQTPKAIFISAFDSAPLAPDVDFLLASRHEEFMEGLRILAKLTSGELFVSGNDRTYAAFANLVSTASHYTTFVGKHPAGCVGVQISKLNPLSKGETIWTIDPQNVAILGRFFRTGKVDLTKIVALTGSEVKNPKYYRTIAGAKLDSIIKGAVKEQEPGNSVRIINGNVLTGTKVEADNYLGYYNNQITIIPEGDKYEMLGWIAPRFNKFSFSKSYFSWLTPNKKYALDTNLNGGERAFVMTGQYEKVVPMDIYPVYLIKAILAGDIDKMENLGIYEVVEEDLALCEFICPSKIEVQEILRNGIRTMIKELN